VLKFIEPMHPTLAPSAPEGEDWIHEIKYDGYRTQLVIDETGVRAFTRNGFDWSDRYPTLLIAAGELRCASAIIDGEAIVQDEQGRSDFAAFAGAMTARPEDIVFMAFDLLHIDGRDVRQEPLTDRRARLRDLIGCHDPSCRLQFSDDVASSGPELFRAVEGLQMEGIVSKRAFSPYRSGRSKAWLKVKCFAEDEFTVIGFETAQGGPPAALLAREADEGLSYAGAAMVTLSGPQRERFWRTVERTRTNRAAVPVRHNRGQWVTPGMRVRARYLRGSDKLRHATLLEILP
jgi:DNA ligase D-like protein (predicted ligase)